MRTLENREILYQAMLSRDRRFDGRFFVGVTSTGIYCRPVCPAPKPKFKNVLFYPSAAGAEAGGFRPCKRCRPDASPGTPVWSGTSATVSQALQLIENGFLDEHGVARLGAMLGISDRQLRRLFKEHLGAPPLAVALTRRLDFARKLIDETHLNMTEIAFASGFESIRRFNDAVKKRFLAGPTELRNLAQGKSRHKSKLNHMILQLPFRPPLNWEALLNYLAGRATQGVEMVQNNCYCRSIRVGKQSGVITIRPSKREAQLELTIQLDNTARIMAIVHRVLRIFDLGADPLSINGHLLKDEALKPVVNAFPGLRVPGAWDNFELAIRTIIGQQVSIQGANTITHRLVQRYGELLPGTGIEGITHLFPKPSVLADVDLTGLGIPGKRAATLSAFAGRVASGDISLDGNMDSVTVKQRLMAVPGIGPWTTEYIAMRALRDPDAFPGSDLALKRELQGLSVEENKRNHKKLLQRADIWRPWRSYAAIYLWKKYAANMEEKK